MRHDVADFPALECLIGLERGWQRPLLQLQQRVPQIILAERVDLNQQGAGIVLTAGQVRRADQGFHRRVEVVLFAQNRANARIAQRRPDPVADQQQALAFTQFAVQVIHDHVLIQAQRTLEYMLHVGLFPDVIFTDAFERPGLPAINPAVADMGEGEAPTAQYQSAEGGQQAVGQQPAILRQQQAIKGLRHAPGFRRGVIVEGQRLEGGLRGQCAVGTLADAVGKGEQIAFAGRQRRDWRDQAHGVLILRSRSAGAELRELQLQGHRRFRPEPP